eukprot:GILI01006450.1.p1 GENE.GILI01006450.1~~GILI01006450.1.p1  ORF type:complete len:170 (-),score=59.24 GILI01006450.1:163-672(-)
MGKPELVLQSLDEWMIRWRHYQHEDDYAVEKKRQSSRKFNYGLALSSIVATGLYTMGRATVNRTFGAPHFFDNGVDVQWKTFWKNTLNGTRRYTPMGYGRVLFMGVPAYLIVAIGEHRAEQSRLDSYLAANTVFGEQARRLVKSGKIEEFLAVKIKAPLPENEAVIYPQ